MFPAHLSLGAAACGPLFGPLFVDGDVAELQEIKAAFAELHIKGLSLAHLYLAVSYRKSPLSTNQR